MSININDPKSRGFNISLRFFQFGLQILIGNLISRVAPSTCSTTFLTITLIISYVIIGLNAIFMLYIHCRQKFARIQFFVSMFLNIILTCIVIVMGFVETGQDNCASSRVDARFALFQGVIVIILSLMILFLPFAMIQRYSNSPGNLAWFFVFATFLYEKNFLVWMIILTILALVISALTFISNLIAWIRGTTSGIKTYLIVSWVLAIILMVIGIILAVIAYLVNSNADSYKDIVAKKILQIFVAVSVLDFLFWLLGTLTLNYENGDKIRENLFADQGEQAKNPYIDMNDQDNHHQQDFGTIK